MTRKQGIPHFIEHERAKGTSEKTIVHKLLDAGWSMDIIKKTMEGGISEGKPRPARQVHHDKSKKDKNLIKIAANPFIIGAAFIFAVLVALFI